MMDAYYHTYVITVFTFRQYQSKKRFIKISNQFFFEYQNKNTMFFFNFSFLTFYIVISVWFTIYHFKNFLKVINQKKYLENFKNPLQVLKVRTVSIRLSNIIGKNKKVHRKIEFKMTNRIQKFSQKIQNYFLTY